MAVIKLSKSKKALTFVDDSNVVYCVALSPVQQLITSENSGKFIVLTRMPLPASDTRYPKSKLYKDPLGLIKAPDGEVTNNNDGLSMKYLEKIEESIQFQDKQIEW